MSIFFIEDKSGDFFSTDGKRRFIRLSGKAAYEYLSIHKGKRFYKLTSENGNEDSIFIEIPISKISNIRKSERHNQYAADCKKKSQINEVSLYDIQEDKDDEKCNGEELIEDCNMNVEDAAIHKIQLEKLYQAIKLLSKDEQELIACIYNDEPMTVRELSKKWKVHYSSISRKHTAILKKLQKFLK